MFDRKYLPALSSFGALTDPQLGIIRSVDTIDLVAEDPPVFLVTAEPCDTMPLFGIRAANRGAACAVTWERALAKACGESVERYCSAYFDFSSMLLASPEELSQRGLRHILPGGVYAFADWQYEQPGFRFQPVRGADRLRWVAATELSRADEVWVPASLVYVPYMFDAAVEPFTHMPISTGLAAGPSPQWCIDKGIAEIIERDALMITWHNRLMAPQLRLDSCQGHDDELDRLLAAAALPGTELHINLLTVDIAVPVLLVAITNPLACAEQGPPLSAFGLGADACPVAALKSALEEALLTRTLLHRSAEINDSPGYVHRRYESLRDHMLAHATDWSLRARLDFLFESGTWLSLTELRQRFAARPDLAREVMDQGHAVITKDLTTPDVRAQGLHVVRSIIPGLQPLDDHHDHRFLGGQRLHSVPRRLGLRPAEPFNPDPHPFP